MFRPFYEKLVADYGRIVKVFERTMGLIRQTLERTRERERESARSSGSGSS